MKRRTTIFGLVWAFAVNALWVPGGLDGGYLISVFFPAWYLFLLGMVIGGAHEALATRWPRLWMLAAFATTLSYASVALFAGNPIGLWLALPMSIATGLASKMATLPRLTGHRLVPLLGRALLVVSCWTLFRTTTCLPYWDHSIQEKVSPNGAYIFRIERQVMGSLSSEKTAVHLGPRYAPPTWFSAIVASSDQLYWADSKVLHSPYLLPEQVRSNYLNVRVVPIK